MISHTAKQVRVNNEDRVLITTSTGKTHAIKCDWPTYQSGLAMVAQGKQVYEAFPGLSSSEQEFMLSGITLEEWHSIFGEEPVKDDQATKDQMAKVMLLHGTPEQRLQALEYAGIKVDPIKALAAVVNQLQDMIRQLIDTDGVYRVDARGPDGWVCPWCKKLDEHENDCLKHKAAKLVM